MATRWTKSQYRRAASRIYDPQVKPLGGLTIDTHNAKVKPEEMGRPLGVWVQAWLWVSDSAVIEAED